LIVAYFSFDGSLRIACAWFTCIFLIAGFSHRKMERGTKTNRDSTTIKGFGSTTYLMKKGCQTFPLTTIIMDEIEREN
jgi:hypothetical protein